VVAWLLRDEPTLPCCLPELDDAKKSKVDPDSFKEKNESQSELFIEQLGDQRLAFLEKTGLTEEQYTAVVRAMKIFVDTCAKRCKAAPIEVGWEKMKEAGIIPKEQTMSALLYVISTGGLGLLSSPLNEGPLALDSLLGGKGGSILDAMDEMNDPHQTDNKETENTVRKIDIKEEVSVFHDLLYDPTEKSVSLRVKAMAARGEAKGAEALLERFKSIYEDSDKEVLRLRTFMPILKYYCENGDVSSALKVFKMMRNTPTVFLEPENYVLLIATIAENGFFRENSEPISGANDLGYKASAGPDLFDELVEEMAEDALEISSALARRLYNSFAVGFKGLDMAKHLKQMHSLAGMFPTNEVAEDGELVASRVVVDAQSAMCPRTKAKLRLISLGEDQRKKFYDTLLELSMSRMQQFQENFRKPSDHAVAAEQLARFANWLNKRPGAPFTAIVDGPNVAYYMQNFDQGKFNYHQLQFVVDALVSMKENPLVILPFKYTKPKFPVSNALGGFQTLGQKELDIMEGLKRDGRLYTVPPGCLDDFYWILASISDQAKSRNGEDLDILPDNKDGRWPGTRPMLVSNDQMRDHKLMMMEPRLFRRWYSCHIVNYNFTAFVDDECVDREIGLSPPDFFSREIQGNPTPGGGSGKGGDTVWHFPVNDWGLNDRFCIRIPREA